METFGGGVDTGIKCIEARDVVTKHPTKHRMATWPKMSVVLRLRNNGLGFANSSYSYSLGSWLLVHVLPMGG